VTTSQFDVPCTGCGQLIYTTLDAVQHADCHHAGDLADGPTCGHLRPILRIAGVDLPTLSCVRAPGHAENLHRGADGSEWADAVPDWFEQTQQKLGDILAALIRRTGADRVELADDELAKREPDEMVRYQYDDDGCALVEITTEVPE
jgi:hypothetical protein